MSTRTVLDLCDQRPQPVNLGKHPCAHCRRMVTERGKYDHNLSKHPEIYKAADHFYAPLDRPAQDETLRAIKATGESKMSGGHNPNWHWKPSKEVRKAIISGNKKVAKYRPVKPKTGESK